MAEPPDRLTMLRSTDPSAEYFIFEPTGIDIRQSPTAWAGAFGANIRDAARRRARRGHWDLRGRDQHQPYWRGSFLRPVAEISCRSRGARHRHLHPSQWLYEGGALLVATSNFQVGEPGANRSSPPSPEDARTGDSARVTTSGHRGPTSRRVLAGRRSSIRSWSNAWGPRAQFLRRSGRCTRARGRVSAPRTLLLRPAQPDVALGAEDVRVEIGDPLAAAGGHVEIADGGLHVLGNAVPVKLRVFVDEIGGAVVAELPIEAGLLELIIEGVRFADVVGIAELADQVGGPEEVGFLVDRSGLRRARCSGSAYLRRRGRCGPDRGSRCS